MSRKCQHHEAQLHGILTDGALVIIAPEVKNPPSPASKAVMLLADEDVLEMIAPTIDLFSPKREGLAALQDSVVLAGAQALEVLSPTRLELTSGQLSSFPLLAEATLFLLICVVITKLSFDLGKEHNKRILAFTS